jgi:hypothetical protein
MCKLSLDEFYEDMAFDAEYQDWLRTKKQQEIDRWYAEYYAEQEARDKMAEEYFNNLKQMEEQEA